MLRHAWATNYNRSGSGSRFDLQVEGGWNSARIADRYRKIRPVDEHPSRTVGVRGKLSGSIRETLRREALATADKRAAQNQHCVATNSDAVCSPDGIRTHDLFLERKRLQKGDLEVSRTRIIQT